MRETRKPTGKPSWPIMLLAAGEKNGKTYSALEASASDLIGATYVVSVGEDDPDEYGLIPGANFDIVPHDGTHRDMLDALRDASARPRVGDGSKPNLLILDGAGRWWVLLSDMAQEAANRRAKKTAEKYGKRYDPDEEAKIHTDLWNQAKDRWYDVVDVLRAHDGPVIVTALLENQTVMDAAGQPTKDRTWKIKAQKNFASDVGVIVEAPEYREWYVTGVRSVKFQPVKSGEHTADNRFPDFTVDKLWRTLGLGDSANVGQRAHNATTVSDDSPDEIMAAVAQALTTPLEQRVEALGEVWRRYGTDVMNAVQVTAPDGSTCTGAQLVTGWVDATKAEIAKAQQPPAQQQEQAPQGGEQQVDRKDPHTILMDEIAGMAQAIGANAADFVKPLIAEREGAAKVRDVPWPKVLAWVALQRPMIAKALRDQGKATEADAIDSYPADALGTWAQVTSPRESIVEEAKEPARA